ncbi:galanin receptor 2a-like [Montipora foliosa]|uniref:galanin receptor 2a-like n=1 Tax=Montipora foliosa TaxID=591990 RepID=UPI0035F16FD3
MNNSTITDDVSRNNQMSCRLSPPDMATKTTLTVIYVIIGTVALFGNCAIILIAKTKKRIRKVAFNFFIISMAVADILDGLIAVPKMVTSFYFDELWFGGLIGNITCKLLSFLPSLSLVASVSTLAAISVERYLAIVHVLREPLSKRKVKLALLFLWIFSSFMVSTTLIKFKSEKHDGKYLCYGIWSDNLETNLSIYRYEVVAYFVFFYAVPFSLMIVLYTLIIRVLKRRQAFGENMSQNRIQAQNVTVVKMLVTVVLLFAFVWLPTHILLLMSAFDHNTLQCVPTSVILLLTMLAHANGALNPCIYLIFNENYRKGLKQLLVKCRSEPVKGIGIKKDKQWWPGSSTLERDPSRAGIKGFFRDLSKVSRGNSDEVTYETRF